MKACKAFDKNMQCRGFQFEVGKTYKHDGAVKACESGFHACENPLDVWNYYPLDSRYAVVSLAGEIDKQGGDSKAAASVITVEREITLASLISDGVAYMMALGEADSGDSSQIAASGDSSQIAASGDSSQIAASGYNSRLAASGEYSRLAASGASSRLAASGEYSRLAASGEDSVCVAAAPGAVAQAAEGGAIALTYHDGERYRIAVAYVGENGVEPNVAYRVTNEGKFIKAEES